jgi:hypothetical protein
VCAGQATYRRKLLFALTVCSGPWWSGIHVIVRHQRPEGCDAAGNLLELRLRVEAFGA